MRIFDGVTYREETEAEIAERLAEQNRQKLAEMQSLTISRDGLIDYLLSQVNVTLPTGESTTADKVADTTIDLPVKVGFKWEQHGNSFVLVADPDAVGTADNPIIWFDGCAMIDNAFYIKDGTRYVCMAGELIEF